MQSNVFSIPAEQESIPRRRKRVVTTSIPDGPEMDQFIKLQKSNFHPSHFTTSHMTAISRTAFVFFFVGFIWHSTILPFIYTQLGPEIASLIALSGSHVDAFKDPHFIDPQVLREFGFAGAASHTIIFMFGFVCSSFLRTVGCFGFC